MRAQKVEESHPTFFIALHMNGMRKAEREKYERIKSAYGAVMDGLEHESSRELCKLGNLSEMRLMEVVEFPLRSGPKPTEEKAAHIMAESIIFNIGVKNSLGAGMEDRREIYLLLRDLGIMEKDIVIDTLSEKVPYDERHKGGLIAVRDEGELKTPEAVAYARLYKRYLKEMQLPAAGEHRE